MKTKGRLANRGVSSLVKEAAGHTNVFRSNESPL